MIILVIIVGKLIHTEDSEILPVDVQHPIGLEIGGREEVFLVDLARLVQGEFLEHLLSFEHQGEGVSPVVGGIHFADVDGVIGQVVMDDVGVLGLDVELQDFSVVLQKLFLGLDTAAPQLVFEVVHHLRVLNRDIFIL